MVTFQDLALAGYFKRVHSCLLQILLENPMNQRKVHLIKFLGDKLEIRASLSRL